MCGGGAIKTAGAVKEGAECLLLVMILFPTTSSFKMSISQSECLTP